MTQHQWHVSSAAGLVVGLASRIVLVPTVGVGPFAVVLGRIAGAGIGLIVKGGQRSYLDSIMAGGTFGVPLWAIVSVIVTVTPIFKGSGPQWHAGNIDYLFPALVSWILFGALVGLLSQMLLEFSGRYLGITLAETTPILASSTQVVIVGGGFGGV